MIPKIIHYCWLSDDPIPEDLQKYMKTWGEKLSDYEFKKWDFSVFEKQSSPWVEEAFDNKKYAFACDYIRLYALYNNGGIYMDMDIEVLKSFNPLLNNQYMIAYERDTKIGIEAGCFGAEPHSEFIKKCLDYYENRHFVNEDGQFDQTTLPMIMQGVANKGKIEIEIYPWDYFTSKSYETGEIHVTSNSFAIHHFAGSWKTSEEKKYEDLSRLLDKKYGKIGRVYFKIYKYILHPKNLVRKIKNR